MATVEKPTDMVLSPPLSPLHPIVCHLSTFVSISPSLCLSLHPSVYLSTLVSISSPFCLSLHPSVYLFIIVSISPPLCLSLYPSVCLSTAVASRKQEREGLGEKADVDTDPHRVHIFLYENKLFDSLTLWARPVMLRTSVPLVSGHRCGWDGNE